MAGYSQRPLAAKLGLKDGQHVAFSDIPDHLPDIAGFPGFATHENAVVSGPRDRDYIHVFVRQLQHLAHLLPILQERLKADGLLWISWPKKASKVPTDITEGRLREMFLPLQLVDVKVCAIDEVWSGLKFVWRKDHRKNVI